MKQLPPFQLSFPNSGDDIVSKCDSALQIILAAQDAGVVDAPAISLSDFTANTDTYTKLKQLNPIRFKVIAKQLWLLGYLKEEPRRNISPTHQETADFRDNLRRFQRDAGLIVDGWLGEQTWKTLQELVSFETPIDPKHWQLPNGKFRTAFNRALQLRMWAYGFIEKKPAYNFAGLKAKDLTNTRRMIGILCSPKNQDYDWRSILLDSDKILSGAINVIEQHSAIAGADKITIRRLLISIARVELWLLGFEVYIDSTDDYTVENFGVKRNKIRRGGKLIRIKATNYRLKKGLKQFWGELMGHSPEHAAALSSSLSLDFFKSLQNPESFAEETDPFEEPDFSQQAAETLKTTDDIKAGYMHYCSLGMKLWDGVKRIWRWLVKGIKKIVQLADNLIRGFFRFATKSYIIVRTALIALTTATQQYIKGRVEKTGKHVVFIDKDFDYKLIVNDKEQPSIAVDAIQRFSAGFLFSSKLVGLIIDLLTSTAQGVVGWARFLYILVKNYREFVPAYRELQAVK